MKIGNHAFSEVVYIYSCTSQ